MTISQSIIVTEYPKSGGSWIVSMLGDFLDLPRRGIQVKPGFKLFNINEHPWYKDAENLDIPPVAVVKSHELPESELIAMDAIQVHLIRDGRDVVVSKWFFEKDFCVQNGIISSFEKKFDDYVIETAKEWASFISAWDNLASNTIYYEKFLLNPAEELSSLIYTITGQQPDPIEIDKTLQKFTKEKFSASLDKTFKHNSFVRKGVAGDWKNYFSAQNTADFKEIAGQTLVRLGYEEDYNWG